MKILLEKEELLLLKNMLNECESVEENPDKKPGIILDINLNSLDINFGNVVDPSQSFRDKINDARDRIDDMEKENELQAEELQNANFHFHISPDLIHQLNLPEKMSDNISDFTPNSEDLQLLGDFIGDKRRELEDVELKRGKVLNSIRDKKYNFIPENLNEKDVCNVLRKLDCKVSRVDDNIIIESYPINISKNIVNNALKKYSVDKENELQNLKPDLSDQLTLNFLRKFFKNN